MSLRRRPLLAAAALTVLPRDGASQSDLPRPVPLTIKRDQWAAAVEWRSPISAREGFSVAAVEVVRRCDDGVLLLIREEPPRNVDEPAIQHVRLERRDATGRILWQQPVPGLPGRFGRFRARYLAGTGSQASLLVTTFLPFDHRKQAAYGRVVEVDEASGRMRPLGGIARPRTREWIEDEAIELDGALRLEGGRVALHGGFGSGPFSWWVALMRLDGTLLWQTIGPTSAGEVTALRAVPGGFEGSLHIIIAWPAGAKTGVFRMRFDEAGRVVGSVWIADHINPLFAPDGSVISLNEGPPRVLVIEDRYGRHRSVAALPDNVVLRHRLDDGALVLIDDDDHDLVVSGDGRSAIRIERDFRSDTILPDGRIFTTTCAEFDCITRELALYKRPW
ncbi:MAG: hypothetical protein JO055_10790 [Alphaproteobacteria bacterium]|nr:hypothetical protein [Alphaproteobacteria bacterium]